MMKNVILFTLICFSLSVFAVDIKCIVENVHDGDTITVKQIGNNDPQSIGKFSVRLKYIDTPEYTIKKDPTKTLIQPGGKEAMLFLKDLIQNKEVIVKFTGDVSYNRILGVVYFKDINVNKLMLQKGYAWAYLTYIPKYKQDTFILLQKNARQKKLGIWKNQNNQAPWEYRKQRKILNK